MTTGVGTQSGAVGPLRRVLAAFEDGAGSLDQVAATTGLSRETVSAAVDHLVRLGRIDAKQLSMGCPSGGCGSCASGTNGAPGCGAAGPSSERRGPVLVTLTLRR